MHLKRLMDYSTLLHYGRVIGNEVPLMAYLMVVCMSYSSYVAIIVAPEKSWFLYPVILFFWLPLHLLSPWMGYVFIPGYLVAYPYLKYYYCYTEEGRKKRSKIAKSLNRGGSTSNGSYSSSGDGGYSSGGGGSFSGGGASGRW